MSSLCVEGFQTNSMFHFNLDLTLAEAAGQCVKRFREKGKTFQSTQKRKILSKHSVILNLSWTKGYFVKKLGWWRKANEDWGATWRNGRLFVDTVDLTITIELFPDTVASRATLSVAHILDPAHRHHRGHGEGDGLDGGGAGRVELQLDPDIHLLVCCLQVRSPGQRCHCPSPGGCWAVVRCGVASLLCNKVYDKMLLALQ